MSNALASASARVLSTSRIQRTSAPSARRSGRWLLKTMLPAPMIPIVFLRSGMLESSLGRLSHGVHYPAQGRSEHILVVKPLLEILNGGSRCLFVTGEDGFDGASQR